MNTKYGYEHFKEVGETIKRKMIPNIYDGLSIEELERRRDQAEMWLKTNMDNPKYAEGLRRYELIVSLVNQRKYEDAEKIFRS